ncbi:hypothetical protein CA596_22910 [Paenibacillus odorifer]|nr:hypothetical protein CA596_22910 [Paenibacillus odorifer]
MLKRKLFHVINIYLHKYNWRRINKHNFTKAINVFPVEKVIVGKYTYGPLKISAYGNPNEKLVIGNYCSIAEDVRFILGGEHHPLFISNYPFKLFSSDVDSLDDRNTKGPIFVGDDVWIGTGCIILSGVKIGQGAIIAAGSTVFKDVPAYAIYTTNKIIKYRFSPEIIEKLLRLDYSKLEFKFVEDNYRLFYQDINENVLNEPILQALMKE